MSGFPSAGGGGGGAGGSVSRIAGAGGGSGGYIDAIIYVLHLQSYDYSLGVFGSFGEAGTWL